MPTFPAPSSSDPLFGNAASDLLNGALEQDVTQLISDPRLWQPPEPRALQALLPEYEITAFLGRGGMGAVYRGRQISLDRQVAVKILPPGMEEHDATYAVRSPRSPGDGAAQSSRHHFRV